jgi:hypothetical protein
VEDGDGERCEARMRCQQLNAHPSPPHPGGVVEAVYIPEKKRGTLCVSSQVGCSMKCSFCATGAMSKASLRNLTSGEIVSVLVDNNKSVLIPARRWSKCCRRDCLALSPLFFTTLSPLCFTSHKAWSSGSSASVCRRLRHGAAAAAQRGCRYRRQ